MRIPVKAPCYACGERVTVHLTLPDRTISFKCSANHDNAGPVDSPVGSLVLGRAVHEFNANSDFTLAVILAAMAFETELSRFHHKWRRLGAWDQAHDITNEELDDLLRKHVNIKGRIEHIADLLNTKGLEGFVQGEKELRDIINQGYPSLHNVSLAEGFQRFLFWPRNRVLHLGQVIQKKQEAVRALNLARLGIYIFDRMDEAKRAAQVT